MRTYASSGEYYTLAKKLVEAGVKDVKAFLAPKGYQHPFGNKVKNLDYRTLQILLDCLYYVQELHQQEQPPATTKPKKAK